jgi:uncharacterized Zn-finger protein
LNNGSRVFRSYSSPSCSHSNDDYDDNKCSVCEASSSVVTVVNKNQFTSTPIQSRSPISFSTSNSPIHFSALTINSANNDQNEHQKHPHPQQQQQQQQQQNKTKFTIKPPEIVITGTEIDNRLENNNFLPLTMNNRLLSFSFDNLSHNLANTISSTANIDPSLLFKFNFNDNTTIEDNYKNNNKLTINNNNNNKSIKAVKSHVCSNCNKRFARSDMLIRHSRLHSGLRPYRCIRCGQEFSRSDHLNTHLRTHTGQLIHILHKQFILLLIKLGFILKNKRRKTV